MHCTAGSDAHLVVDAGLLEDLHLRRLANRCLDREVMPFGGVEPLCATINVFDMLAADACHESLHR